ncbi:MAG: hypothetical protein J6Q22_11055 [Prevotella sp.]|nr:hypothetical protein [Prevotella sp.]
MEQGSRREVSWDGKMYNKYKIEHTDGTPLKGKKYFVLRLDSDDQIEAARVARAMRAYEGKPRNCDVGTEEEQVARYHAFCYRMMKQNNHCCGPCPCHKFVNGEAQACTLIWAQMPYETEKEV